MRGKARDRALFYFGFGFRVSDYGLRVTGYGFTGFGEAERKLGMRF